MGPVFWGGHPAYSYKYISKRNLFIPIVSYCMISYLHNYILLARVCGITQEKMVRDKIFL